eukprot:5671877-Alexandrium_andersonii.AAC.1
MMTIGSMTFSRFKPEWVALAALLSQVLAANGGIPEIAKPLFSTATDVQDFLLVRSRYTVLLVEELSSLGLVDSLSQSSLAAPLKVLKSNEEVVAAADAAAETLENW